jgi:acyl dehydratase
VSVGDAVAEDPQRLVGFAVPGARGRVEGYENTLLQDAVHAPRGPDPHPIWAFLAPQRGMGLTLAELFDALGCPMSAGPVLGSFGARWHRDLACDAEFAVTGGVTSVRRRQGRVLGVFDEVTLVLELTDLERVPVLTATYGFLLPRRGADPPTGQVPVSPGGRPADEPDDTGAGSPVEVRARDMAVLALLLRDPNPIHFDAEASEALGFGRVCVNQGPANLAYLLGELAHRTAQPAPARCEARFHATVVAGEVVAPVVTADGAHRWRLVLRREDGTPVVTAHAVSRA